MNTLRTAPRDFVFDLDGTICFKGKPLTETILSALRKVEEAGHRVIFASARPIRDLVPVIGEFQHDHLLIGGNGSLVFRNGEQLAATAFSQDTLTRLLALIDAHSCRYLIDSTWNYAYTGNDDHPIRMNLDPLRLAQNVSVSELESVVKMLLLSFSDEEQLLAELKALDIVVHQHGNEGVLDLSPPGIHKAAALQQLGITNYIAFGNDANDVTLFQHADYAVAIGHHPALTGLADEHIDHDENVEQAIAERLAQLSFYTNGMAGQ